MKSKRKNNQNIAIDPEKQIRLMKKKITRMVAASGEGHIPSAFSVIDIIWVLYNKILHVLPDDPNNPNRDWFFLSKGHAAAALYVVLAKKKFFEETELEHYARFNSFLGSQPDHNKIPGVESSTGSLGHGFPMAVGVALGLKIQNKDSRVYALVGDGECNEGSIWEAALIASHHNLKNLICIVDYNHSSDRAIDLGNIAAKFRSFNWEVENINGHNHKEIFNALSKKNNAKPKVVIANTIKGRGVEFMENNPAWHHRSPSPEELELIYKELS